MESAVALVLQQVGPAAPQSCPFTPCPVLSASLAPCPGAVLPTEHPQERCSWDRRSRPMGCARGWHLEELFVLGQLPLGLTAAQGRLPHPRLPA